MFALVLLTSLPVSSVTVLAADFLGFSTDETHAAWQLEFLEVRDSYALSYTLVRVVETGSQRIVADYREGPVFERRSGFERVVDAAATDSVVLARAQNGAAWRALALAEGFGRPLTSRLPDAIGITMTSGVLDRQRGRARFLGSEGIAFHLTGTLLGGAQEHLGYFADPSARLGELAIYVSPSAYHLAGVVSYQRPDGNSGARVFQVRLRRHPIASDRRRLPLDAKRAQLIFGSP
ncbi:MAG: hypothetical protein AAFZ38_09565 [Myxococcota bacterium]